MKISSPNIPSPLSSSQQKQQPIKKVDDQPANPSASKDQIKIGWKQIGAHKAVIGWNILSTIGLGVLGYGVGSSIAGTLGGIGAGLIFASQPLSQAYKDSYSGATVEKQKTGWLKKSIARVGAQVTGLASPILQHLFPNTVKKYQLSSEIKSQLISDKEQEEFISKLKPGDIILSYSETNPTFMDLVRLKPNPEKNYFNHVTLYKGGEEKETIEALATPFPGGVVNRHVSKIFGANTALIAIRPKFKSNEERQNFIDAAQQHVGKKYDWFAQMNDKRLGCVEVPYHGFKALGQEERVLTQKVAGIHTFIFPQDYLHLEDSEVVASVGLYKSPKQAKLAKYAQELGLSAKPNEQQNERKSNS